MQAHSENYAPYTTERFIKMRIEFGLADTEAPDIAVPSVSGSDYPTQLSQVQHYGDMPTRWLAFYPSYMVLDGSASSVIPDDLTGKRTGWWSDEKSDINGIYQTPPTLTFDFPYEVSCIGFTLSFDVPGGEFVSNFTIQTYDESGNEISSGTFDNTSTIFEAELFSENIRKAVFTFNRHWLPYRPVRLAGVLFGIVQKFDERSLIKATQTREISPTMEKLPATEFVFTFNNVEKKYNLANPAGIYRFLQDQQSINATIIVNGQEIPDGKFLYYTSTADNRGLTASITATDFVPFLDGPTYNGGESGTWTLEEATTAVIAASGLSISTNIPADIGARTVGKNIPQGTTCRAALAMLGMAAMTVLYFDRNNELTAADFVESDIDADTINSSNAESVSDVSLEPRVNTIVLTVRDEYANSENIYTAENIEVNEALRLKTINCPVASNGSAVAKWLLDIYQRRVKYTIPARGNPALDPLDTVSITSVFGVTAKANITKLSDVYNGGYSQTIEATGGTFE